MEEKFYSKNGLAAKKIAKELIRLESGEKIPRVSDYSETLSMGRGTVQNALRLLDEMKAIKLEARGHLGTFLVRKDARLLLEIAGIAPLIGSMPLPYSRKYEGLATGIVEAFEAVNKKVNLTYMRGGLNRIDAVRTKRSDFAIVSKMTAASALKEHSSLKIMSKLGLNSYVSTHKIFLANTDANKVQNGMKIGVDMESPDQTELTFTEFKGMNVEYVDINYMQLFEMLNSKQIDAAIWNVDEKRMLETFKAIDFQSPDAKNIAHDTSEAVIVIDSSREQEIAEKWDSVEMNKILEIQSCVEKGEKIPRY